ncbi:MAG: cytochrome c-type biogenesis protein CcmH [Methylococcaceae bacterium]|nr:MAG: cytochrome c-type biogenesis protein CcmH [Methylococcaceae bacterium]
MVRTAYPTLLILLLGVLAWPLWTSAAAMELRQFDDPAKQARYEALIKELRCLVCQNQALSDSDADLAQDLRDEVYRIIQSGKTDQEAVDFLVDRYGDFVLYRPPFNALTWLLWGGPLLLGLVGCGIVWRQWQRHRSATATPILSDADIQRLQQLRAQADRTDDHS